MKFFCQSKMAFKYFCQTGLDIQLFKYLHILIAFTFLTLVLISIKVYDKSNAAFIYFISITIFFLFLWLIRNEIRNFYVFLLLICSNTFFVITAFSLHSIMFIDTNPFNNDFSLFFLGCLLGLIHGSMITTDNVRINLINYSVMQVLSIIKLASSSDSNGRTDIYFWIALGLFAGCKIILSSYSKNFRKEEYDSSKKERDFIRNFLFTKTGHPIFFLKRSYDKQKCTEYLTLIQQNEEALKNFRIYNSEDLRRIFAKINTYSTKQNTRVVAGVGSEYKEKIGSLYEEALEWAITLNGQSRGNGIMLDGDVEEQDSFKSFIINLVPGVENGTLFVSLVDVSHKIDLKRMKALDQYKDKMIETVSHDLRTPLKNVSNVFNLLSIMVANNGEQTSKSNLQDKEANRLIQLGKESCDLMMNFLQSILDLEQIKEGKIKLKLSDFNISQMVKEVVNVIKYEAKEKNVKLNWEIDSELPQEIYSDKIRLKQVLLNLLSNSLKFTNSGEIKVSVKFCRVKNSDCAHFNVQDSGLGIPADIIPKLFKPFSTFEGADGSNSGGVGLGLMICQNIVSLLGPYNRLFCSSKINKGSKFSFVLYNSKEGFDSNKNQKAKDGGGFKQFGLNDMRSVSSFELDFFNEFSITPRIPTNRKFEEVPNQGKQDYSLNNERDVIHSVSCTYSEGDFDEYGGLQNPGNVADSFLICRNTIVSNRQSRNQLIRQSCDYTSPPNDPFMNKSSIGMSHSTEWNIHDLSRLKKNTFLSRGKSNSIQNSNRREDDSLLGNDEYLQTPLSSLKRLTLNPIVRRIDRKVKILIVDDNMFTHSVMEQQFKCCKFEFPFQILHAYNGAEALAVLNEEFCSTDDAKSRAANDSEDDSSPDVLRGIINRRTSIFKRVSILVFTDINMPVMNGHILLEKIKLAFVGNTFPFIPVVCISSEEVKNERDFKFDEVLRVPIDISTLKGSVERWIFT